MSAYKTFPGWTREFVRKEISYVNLMYLLKTVAPYRSSEDKENLNKGNSPYLKKQGKSNIKPQSVTHFEQFKF